MSDAKAMTTEECEKLRDALRVLGDEPPPYNRSTVVRLLATVDTLRDECAKNRRVR